MTPERIRCLADRPSPPHPADHGGLLPNLLWFMGLADPNNAQAGFVSVIVGAGAAFRGLYVNSKTDKQLVWLLLPHRHHGGRIPGRGDRSI